MNNDAKKQQGFSLVEALLAIFILSVIAFITSNIYTIQTKNFRSQKIKLELQGIAKNSIDIIQKDIREAVGVEAVEISQNTSLTPGSDVLILKTPSLDANEDILYDIGGSIPYFDYIIFEFAPGNIVNKYVYPDINSSREETIAIIGTNVNTLSFAYYPSGPSLTTTTAVGVNLSTNKNNISSNFAEQIVKLRNK